MIGDNQWWVCRRKYCPCSHTKPFSQIEYSFIGQQRPTTQRIAARNRVPGRQLFSLHWSTLETANGDRFSPTATAEHYPLTIASSIKIVRCFHDPRRPGWMSDRLAHFQPFAYYNRQLIIPYGTNPISPFPARRPITLKNLSLYHEPNGRPHHPRLSRSISMARCSIR